MREKSGSKYLQETCSLLRPLERYGQKEDGEKVCVTGLSQSYYTDSSTTGTIERKQRNRFIRSGKCWGGMGERWVDRRTGSEGHAVGGP